MKRTYKVAIVAFICLLVVAVSGCGLFDSMGQVAVNLSNGNFQDPTSTWTQTYDVYCFLYAVDDDNNCTELEREKLKGSQRANPNQPVSIKFSKLVRAGTKVKVVVGLKAHGGSVLTNNYNTRYKAESQTFIIHEGVNNNIQFNNPINPFQPTDDTSFIY